MSLCPVPKCKTFRHPDDILCRIHWDTVPDYMKLAVIQGRERGTLSQDYQIARADAIDWAKKIAEQDDPLSLL